MTFTSIGIFIALASVVTIALAALGVYPAGSPDEKKLVGA